MVTGGRSDLLLPGGRAPNHHLTGGGLSPLVTNYRRSPPTDVSTSLGPDYC